MHIVLKKLIINYMYLAEDVTHQSFMEVMIFGFILHLILHFSIQALIEQQSKIKTKFFFKSLKEKIKSNIIK